ncbi:hypothetical protein NW754_000009 [Fusarium falciforme]|nr:hypothetical protein NW754_000009 [Fusarium falciforme]
MKRRLEVTLHRKANRTIIHLNSSSSSISNNLNTISNSSPNITNNTHSSPFMSNNNRPILEMKTV